MLPTRRRSPPSYTRLGQDNSSGGGYGQSGPDGGRSGDSSPRSFDFDIEGDDRTGGARRDTDREDWETKVGELGQGQSAGWQAAAGALQRQVRTVRGRLVFAVIALVLLVHWRPWSSGTGPTAGTEEATGGDVLAADGTTVGATSPAPSKATGGRKFGFDFGRVPDYDESAFAQKPRPVPPSGPDPWAYVETPSFRGREYLSPDRFGSDTLGWKRTRDPPERSNPPARHLLKAFEYTAEVAMKRRDGLSSGDPLAPGMDWDEMTGRPKMLERGVLKLGEEKGWRPDARFHAAELGTEKQAKTAQVPLVQAAAVEGSRSGGTEAHSDDEEEEQRRRREWVKRAFMHAWEGYSLHAYGHDELAPVSGRWSDNYNGWGATLVDSLDTLLMMNMSHEYTLARQHVAEIDFTYLVPTGSETFSTELPDLEGMEMAADKASQRKKPQKAGGKWVDPRRLREMDQHSPTTLSWFETTIRYLGGLLSAYEVSGDPLMLERATELGDWLLPAFATEYGLPINRYALGKNPDGVHVGRQSLAEVGSMTLEMTKLSQLTGDETYFRTAQRAIDTLERRFLPAEEARPGILAGGPRDRGRLGTLLPAFLDPAYPHSLQGDYTLGGLADSYYEYLIKQAQLVSLGKDQYARMYRGAMDSVLQYLVQPLEVIPGRRDLAVLGHRNWGGWQPELQHLACFAGGMFGLGAKLLNRPQDLEVAINVTNACVWAYSSSATGIGPESTTFYPSDEPARFVVLDSKDGTGKRRTPRGRPPGVRSANRRQIGRPETIESVFYMHRLTGDRKWQDQGWTMFVNWVEHAITETGFAAVHDVNTVPVRLEDSMESFVLGETLKYYYLLFSPPDFFSLDDWVFSTEAHPFWRARPGAPRSRAPLWTGPEEEDLASGTGSLVAQRGEGTWVQKWARVQQAADLAPQTIRRTEQEKARAAAARLARENGEDSKKAAAARGKRPRPLVRPSEDELEEAGRKQRLGMKPHAMLGPPEGEGVAGRGGGGRGMGGGG